jgi:hypothetical protein
MKTHLLRQSQAQKYVEITLKRSDVMMTESYEVGLRVPHRHNCLLRSSTRFPPAQFLIPHSTLVTDETFRRHIRRVHTYNGFARRLLQSFESFGEKRGTVL